MLKKSTPYSGHFGIQIPIKTPESYSHTIDGCKVKYFNEITSNLKSNSSPLSAGK